MCGRFANHLERALRREAVLSDHHFRQVSCGPARETPEPDRQNAQCSPWSWWRQYQRMQLSV